MKRACFFDLDGTLIPNPSSESRLLKALIKKLFIYPSGLVIWFLESLFKYRNFKNSKAYYQGMKLQSLQKFIEKELNNFEDALSKQALEHIEQKRKEGYFIYLITGAPDFIVDAIKTKINFEKVYTSELEVLKGKLTGKLLSIIPYGANKYKLVQMIAAEDNIDLSQSIAYGDSYKDLQFLKSTGLFFAVNPESKLKKLVKPEKTIIWEK
ncbi:MAG: HAD family phosphatase [Candidatus Hydrothermia bacterium]